MVTGHDDEHDFLDDSWQTRRFVSPSIHEEERNRKAGEKTRKKTLRIPADIKYYKRTYEPISYQRLSLSEQLRIASGVQQAVIKVTSYGKGFDKVMGHLQYLSRDFDLPLETQDKALLLTREESMDLLASWQASYFDTRKNSRDTVHYVFSAPPGTERGQFKAITREFLSEEYEGEHDYLFVEHDDTEHPHIHAVVCMRSIQGRKLDPRKKYLQTMRKRFAEKCRDNGIILASSRRFERGLSGKSSKSELVQMRQKRQHLPEVDKRFVARIKTEIESSSSHIDVSHESRLKRHQFVRNQFYDSAKKLYKNYMATEESKRQDKEILAAQLLLDYAKSFHQEKSRADFLKEKQHSQSITTSDYNPFARPLSQKKSRVQEKDCEPDLSD